MDKRIFAVALSGLEPVSMVAGYRNGQLHIVKVERLVPDINHLKKTLPDRLKKLHKEGFIVLVDEVIPVFAKYGRPCRLSDVGQDGKPIVVTALEQYNYLHRLRGITFPPDSAGQFEISSSVVDEQRTPKGEIVYNIDWAELRPETTALLLCIHAAMTTSLYDNSSLMGLFSALGARKKPDPAQSAFTAITRGYDKTFLSADGLKRGKHE